MPISARARAISSPMMRRRGGEGVVDGAAGEVPDGLLGAASSGGVLDVVGQPVGGSNEPVTCTGQDPRGAAVVTV
ncbi:hypothetical protein BKH26_07240 [Actinomyces oris]|nr:hypothetical protein BKH26_07240 [Actinomyces oris]